MAAQIFDAHEMDLARHVAALRTAFRGSPWSGEIGATLTEEFYSWKYHTPAGRAKIACIRSGPEPVSGVSAFPMTFELPGHGLVRGWQIGDIMTVPDERGRGLYRKCLTALVEQLDDELLVCFPNDRSRRAMEQAGFAAVAEIKTFVRPVLIPFAGRGSTVPDAPGLFGLAGSSTTTPPSAGVHRNQEYLEWRYARHPVFHYQAVGEPEGVAVVRSFRLLGADVAVVMEFHPTDGLATPLLNKVHRWARENRLVACFLMANWFPMKPLRAGYLFVPPALLPKRQVLFVRYPRGRAIPLDWKTQIGDWDGL